MRISLEQAGIEHGRLEHRNLEAGQRRLDRIEQFRRFENRLEDHRQRIDGCRFRCTGWHAQPGRVQRTGRNDRSIGRKVPGALEVIEPGQQAAEHDLGHQRCRSSTGPRCLSGCLLARLLAEQTLLQCRRRVERGHAGGAGSSRVFADIRGGDDGRLRGRNPAADHKVIERQIDRGQELAKMLFKARDPVQRPVVVVVHSHA